MGERLLGLLRNYLMSRKQKTRVHNTLSSLELVNVGVPQGSTIGPIMFIVYINDLPTVLEHSKSLMYADDTVLYCGHINDKNVRKLMQDDLNAVQV